MLKWIIGGLVAAAIGYAYYVANYVGAFKPVEIKQILGQTFYLLGKTHIGPYHKIVSSIESVESWAKSKNLDCAQTFGLYLDDPTNVEEARLQSFGGCVLTEEKFDDFKNKKSPDQIIPQDFELREFASTSFIQADFSGSPGIGPLKVYPKIQDYIQDHQLKSLGKVLERYTLIPGSPMTTTYFFSVE